MGLSFMKKKFILIIVLILVIAGLTVGAVLLFDKSGNNNTDIKIPDTNQPHSEVVRNGGADSKDDLFDNNEKEDNNKENSTDNNTANDKNLDQDKDILNAGYTYIYNDDNIREKVPLSDLTEADEKNDKGGSSKEKDSNTVKNSEKETKN